MYNTLFAPMLLCAEAHSESYFDFPVIHLVLCQQIKLWNY